MRIQHTDASSAWVTLATWLPPRNADSHWWFETTGPQLMRVLSEAGYPLSRQYEVLLFHYHAVVPHLGPRPISSRPSWRSFMTDDFSPIEYSWKWAMGSGAPEVRYGIEALSHLAGTPVDPLNQIPTSELLYKLGVALPGLDLTWFHHFRRFFFGAGMPPANGTDRGNSSLFLAFEMAHDNISVKAYFIPVEMPGQSVADQISAAIRASGCRNLAAIDEMEAYLDTDPQGSSLKPFMLGIDCVRPSESRLKVYVRSSRTSFDFVRNVMTLGGRRKECLEEAASGQFHQLWKLTLGLGPDFPATGELPRRGHSTSGTCFYFDVGPKSAVPDVKAYIPVRHYAESDRAVAKGLVRFLEERGRAHYAGAYVQAVESLATAEGIDAGTGVQTYISCAYQQGQVSMTSYLSPQLYHSTRWHDALWRKAPKKD